MKKRILSLLLSLLVFCAALPLFTSCGTHKPTVGILRFGSHASLLNCEEGILAGLSELGITGEQYDIRVKDANFDTGTARAQADYFINMGAELVIAIATPSAIMAANAADGSVPVVYCAVTDPTVMEHYPCTTGVSDIPSFEKQLETVVSFMGREDLRIGVLSSAEESSSPVQLAALRRAAEGYTGMEICSSVISDITAIDTKMRELIEGRRVDCLLNLLDNTVVGKLESNILPLANAAGIPVFASEVEQVRVGCLAGASIDYTEVGRMAGEMAARILRGESAESLPRRSVSDPTVYYRSDVAKSLGISVPLREEYIDLFKET